MSRMNNRESYSEEQQIVAKNIYGPNGVEVSQMIENLQGLPNILMDVVKVLKPDELRLLKCMETIQQHNRVPHLNRAVEDAQNALTEMVMNIYASMGKSGQELDQYLGSDEFAALQDIVEAIIEEVVIADILNK